MTTLRVSCWDLPWLAPVGSMLDVFHDVTWHLFFLWSSSRWTVETLRRFLSLFYWGQMNGEQCRNRLRFKNWMMDMSSQYLKVTHVFSLIGQTVTQTLCVVCQCWFSAICGVWGSRWGICWCSRYLLVYPVSVNNSTIFHLQRECCSLPSPSVPVAVMCVSASLFDVYFLVLKHTSNFLRWFSL